MQPALLAHMSQFPAFGLAQKKNMKHGRWGNRESCFCFVLRLFRSPQFSSLASGLHGWLVAYSSRCWMIDVGSGSAPVLVSDGLSQDPKNIRHCHQSGLKEVFLVELLFDDEFTDCATSTEYAYRRQRWRGSP